MKHWKWWFTGMFCMLLLACGTGKKEPGAVVFFEGTYSEALEKARAENKTLYVFVYTDWCGYCKKMTRNIFSKAEVREAHAGFINVKVNGEKGEGVELIQEFGIRAFPTQLFIDSQGLELYRVKGYTDVAQTVQNAKMIEQL